MKAVLVIDMPHCCHDCILADWDQCLCKAKNKEIYSQEYMDGGRQKWCPLRPLPKERQHGDMELIDWDYDAEQVYALGFNKCLHEITGETE